MFIKRISLAKVNSNNWVTFNFLDTRVKRRFYKDSIKLLASIKPNARIRRTFRMEMKI